MYLKMLKSKLHRAITMEANIDYEGSISICKILCEKVHIHAYEHLEIYNCHNGKRFSTYAIIGENNEICLKWRSSTTSGNRRSIDHL